MTFATTGRVLTELAHQSFWIFAFSMMSLNIGISLAMRAAWPLPVKRGDIEARFDQPFCISGRLRMSSMTFSSLATTSGGVLAGATSAQ